MCNELSNCFSIKKTIINFWNFKTDRQDSITLLLAAAILTILTILTVENELCSLCFTTLLVRVIHSSSRGESVQK